jgi:hypothetical protein
MKSLLTSLWLHVLHDCVRQGSYPGTTRDSTTVESRVEKEGESFLTITLPSFCRDFERSLDRGSIDPTSFASFAKNGLIPRFLGGITGRIFDEYGILRPNVDIKAIEHVRQLTNMFKKLEADCTPKRVQKALDAYEDVERDLAKLVVPNALLERFGAVSDYLWHHAEVSDLDTIRPKFGPGVTADRLSHSQRRTLPTVHERIDSLLPFYGNLYSIGSCLEGRERHSLITEEREEPVRVLCVPKTLKGPRIIAAEPAVMQYVQQGVLDHVNLKMRKYSAFIDTRDQTRNQRLALSPQFATLDLSSASDRLHGALVYRMLKTCPYLRDLSFACRSTKAKLPSGKVIPLQKFASMGSALCFPYQTMAFFTMVVMACLGTRPIRAIPQVLQSLEGSCSVYGDDIIVPVEYASSVVGCLESFGLKVNQDKSFFTGRFRESCGVDAYDGVVVTPSYVIRHPKEDAPSTIVSLVSLANKFYSRGYHDAAYFIKSLPICKKIGWSPDERFVGFVFGCEPVTRYNKSLWRREFVTHVPVGKSQSINIDGYDGLTDWFIRALRARDTQLMRERSKVTPLKIKRVWTCF